MDREDGRETPFDTGTEPATPRVIVKALLRAPLVDRAIAHALVAKYVPTAER